MSEHYENERLEVKVAKLEVELVALERLMDERLKASIIAIDKATGVLNQRLETMNEFRTQITSERMTYLTKSEFEAKHEALRTEIDLKIDQLRLDIVNLRKDIGSSLQPLQQTQSYDKGRNTTLAAIIAIVVSVVITLIGHFI